MDYDADIIIVGSGPAGSATALNLARRAPHMVPRTLILEKARHPRPKLCGGGILPDGERLLQRLGIDLQTLPHADVTEACFMFEGRGFSVKTDPVSFRVVHRQVFDAHLAQQVRMIGFTLQEDTTVYRLKPAEQGVIVETNQGNYRAKAVVGADGAHSVVRRAVDPQPTQRTARLFEIFAPPVFDPQPVAQGGHQAVFEFAPIVHGVQGYFWDFPMIPAGAPEKPFRNQGVYDSRIVGEAPLADLKALFPQWNVNRGLDPENCKRQSFPLRWFDPRANFSAPHVLLTGDAAGIDPAYGEGISFSLGYGEIAAAALQDAVERNDFSFQTYRDRVLRHPMGKILKRRRVLARFLYSQRNPWMLRQLFWNCGWLMRWVIQTFLIDWSLESANN